MPRPHALISASVIGVPVISDAELERQIRSQLGGWFGSAVERWEYVRTYRIAGALPVMEPAGRRDQIGRSRSVRGYMCVVTTARIPPFKAQWLLAVGQLSGFWRTGPRSYFRGKSYSPTTQRIAALAGIVADRAGRVPVGPDLSVPGYPDVFVIGDMAVSHPRSWSGGPP